MAKNYTQAQLSRALAADRLDEAEPANPRIQALAGNSLGIVAVPDRPGFIYCRLNGDSNRTTVARCADLPVAGTTIYVQKLRSGLPGISSSYEVVAVSGGALASSNVSLTSPIGTAQNLQAALDYLNNWISVINDGLGGWGTGAWGGAPNWGGGSRALTRKQPLNLWPMQGYKDTPSAGDVHWSINHLAGPATIVWRAGSNLTYKWVQANGTIPQDFARNLVIKARLKVVTGGSATNLTQWQFYCGIFADGSDETWNVSNPDTLGTNVIGTTWKTITLKSLATLPAGMGAGSYVACNFGIGANTVTLASDIYLADLWMEYDAAF